MSFRDPRVTQWERQLKAVFDRIDHELEDRCRDRFARHPVRPARGTTANPESDGLVCVSASFSAGFGSVHGEGYLVGIRLATLTPISGDVAEELERFVEQRLAELLPEAFPDRSLSVVRDGPMLKIVGDLSL